LNHPAELFLERGDGEQFCLENRFVIHENVAAAVFYKTVNQLTRKVMDYGLLRAHEDQGFVEKKK